MLAKYKVFLDHVDNGGKEANTMKFAKDPPTVKVKEAYVSKCGRLATYLKVFPSSKTTLTLEKVNVSQSHSMGHYCHILCDLGTSKRRLNDSGMSSSKSGMASLLNPST